VINAPRFLVSATSCETHPNRTEACAFQVAWQINPHMRVGAVETARAQRQHGAFVTQLSSLGAVVDAMPFVHGAYDSVFAKDSAVLAHTRGCDRALMAQPRHAERQAEQATRRQSLESRGFEVIPPPLSPLEGGDVVVDSLSPRPSAYLGYGFRSSRRSVDALERFLGVPVTPVELRDPTLYHLDMAVAVLVGVTFVCEEALTPASMRTLVSAAGSDHVVRISRAEALAFALNYVRVGRHIVLSRGASSFERRLQGLGYATHALPLSEFHLAGGSAACLVANVHTLDADARPMTSAA
jgi:N-dimethylarginine dimethylaminohydrolase